MFSQKPKTITIIRDVVLQRLPLVLLVLGFTSISLIIAADHISRSMRQAYLYTDALHESEIELSKAHLALQENLKEVQIQDTAHIWQSIDRAENMILAALNGGQTLHGHTIKPLQDDSIRKDMENLRSLIVSFRELARNVYKNRALSEIRSMDSAYHQFLEKAFILDEELENLQAQDEQRSKKLILLILVSWTGIISAAVIGLWYREVLSKRMQAAILNAKHQWEHTFDVIPDLIAVIDKDHRIVRANKAMAEKMGLEPKDILGRKCYELFHKTSGPIESCPHARLLHDNQEHAAEIYEKEFDAHFLVSVSPLLDDHNSLIGSVHVARNISAQKKNAEALKASEERYALTLYALNEGLWDWNVPSGSAYFSPQYYALLEYDDREFPASYASWRLLVHPEDLERVEEELRRSVESGMGFTIDLRMKLKSGKWRWVSTRGRVVERDAEGKVLRMVGTLSDITERKHLEETQLFLLKCGSQHSGEDFFQALAQYLALSLDMDFVCIDRLVGDGLTARTVAVFHNGKFEDNVEYALKDTPCGDVVGKTICCFPRDVSRLFPQDAVLQEMMAESYIGTTLWSFDQKPIGLIALISSKPLMNAGLAESVLRLVALRAAGELERREVEEELLNYHNRLEELVAQRTNELAKTNEKLRMEVLGHEQTSEALQLSERSFRRLSQEFNILLDAIPDSLVLMSSDLKVKWANKSALITAEAQGSEYCYTLWHKRDRPCDDCPVLRSFQSGNPETIQLSTPDNRLWAVRTYPIRDEHGQIESVMELSTDITEKKIIQAEQMRANHLASIGELAAGVAHEINNPINGIINYAQIIVNSADPENREYDIAKRIIKEGERISFIVTSLLSFARERKEDKIPIAVQQVLADALALIEMQLKKSGIDLRLDLSLHIPLIKVHAQQIQQVFLNIINNARYALSQKYPQPDPDKILLITAGEAIINGEPFVQIVFEDHGIGIPGHIIDKVMNPFYTTKPVGIGTGLGLSISHGIIVDHNGRLSVESKEGAYTRIIVSLPAYREKEDQLDRL